MSAQDDRSEKIALKTKEDNTQLLLGVQEEEGTVKGTATSALDAVLITVGTIIGTGIFMTPNSIVAAIPSIFWSLSVWLTCGVISLLGGLCYTELGLMYPKCGGEYEYLIRAYGNVTAFSFLFSNTLFIKPVSIAILVLFFVETSITVFMPTLATIPFWPARFISVACTILICLLNCLSEVWTKRVNRVLTYSKLGCMLLIISLAVYKLALGQVEHVKDLGFRVSTTAAGVATAFYNGMWAYDGFNQPAYMVEDMENLTHTLPIVFFVGLLIIIVFYMAINISYLIVLGVPSLAQSSNVAKDVASIYMGRWSGIVTALVALSAFGAANATSYCGGRIYYDAAKNGHLPTIIACRHVTRGTYIPALIFQTMMTCFFLLIASDINVLLTYFCGASWVFYTATFIAVPVLRYRQPDRKRTYKVFILFPIVISILGVAIVALGFIQDWVGSLISTSIIIASGPVYLMFISKHSRMPKSIQSKLQSASDKIARICNFELIQN